MSTATLERHTDVVDRSACTATKHGTQGAYAHYRCRCADARAADSTRRAELRRAHIAAGKPPRARPSRAQPPRPKLTDPTVEVWSTSTRDRLRVLIAVGYGSDTLTGRLPEQVVALASATRPRIITRHVAGQVAAVFADLIRYPAPFGAGAERALDHAVDAGWGVVDMVAVRQALVGCTHRDPTMRTKVELTPLERKAVIFYGAVLGYTDTALGRAVNASGDTVTEALDKDLPSADGGAA